MNVQRWIERHHVWEDARSRIDPTKYGVELLEHAPAHAFVCQQHYSGSFPSARRRVGLYRTDGHHQHELVGVAVFSVPAQHKAIPAWLEVPPEEGVELGRFVLLDGVPGNGETWFLARAFDVLRQELPEVKRVLAYSDPVERVSASGEVVMPGHVGTIYQAHNGAYLGRSSAKYLSLDPDGRVISRCALSKITGHEKGRTGAIAQLVKRGAGEPIPGEDDRAYVQRALREIGVTRVRHPGNHVYGWDLYGKAKHRMKSREPYPKKGDGWRGQMELWPRGAKEAV